MSDVGGHGGPGRSPGIVLAPPVYVRPTTPSESSVCATRSYLVRNTKSVGKIELLAVAAAGKFIRQIKLQLLDGHFREDAVSRKNILCLIQTLACVAPNGYNAGVTC